jgi:hypothetical protein
MERAEGPCMRRVAAAIMAVALLLAEAMSGSALTGWTTVGSAGTVDEASASIVSLSGPHVFLQTNCILAIIGIDWPCILATGIVTVRYNIVPTGALNSTGFAALKLSTRFRDTGDNQRVLLLLKEVNLQSGIESTLVTFDSDSFASSTNYQTQTGPRPCAFTFDFDANSYYVEARISNLSGSGVSPGLESISISRCPTL